MSTRCAARDQHRRRPFLIRALAVLHLAATALAPVAPLHAQPLTAHRPTPRHDPVIVNLLANGVQRGVFTLLRQPDGDLWVSTQDLPRLPVQPAPGARRESGAKSWYSLRAMGATVGAVDEVELAVTVDFPAQAMPGTTIDLSPRPARVEMTPPQRSLILSYRLSTRYLGASTSEPARTIVTLDNDFNVRWGGVLLRQETRLDTSTQRRLVRGVTQAIWDNPRNAVRTIAGDVISSAGPYGTAITGGGLQVSKLYDLVPDVVRQPAMSLQATANLPSQVEVSVDGSTVYRTDVGPGPIAIDNLLLYGGTRDVRLTITDASGRREVIERPFLFTDTALARGFHEYSYFLGKRSTLGTSNEWRYLEPAWQGYHRYGVTDSLTVSAGGEGDRDFTTGGGGITLRSDRLGLLSVDLLASHDRTTSSTARGWSARYSYATPAGAFVLARRQFGEGFRTFTTTAMSPFVRSETRIGASFRLWSASVGADWVRREDANEARDIAAVRMAMNLRPSVTMLSELQATRVNDRPEWAAYVFLRVDIDGKHWSSTTARVTSGHRTFDVEAGRHIDQGEGFGYRIGMSSSAQEAGETSYAFGAANYNLRAFEVGLYGSVPMRGSGARYGEVVASGAAVAIDGFWGVTRRVSDSFVLARLGVPQPGVEISVNNQVQGRTDERGWLFIPQVGAFGRQDITLNDKQLGIQYNATTVRRTIAPPYRSGTVVDFGAYKMRAVAGMTWQVRQGARRPIASRAWVMKNGDRAVQVETGKAGDFYLEDAPPGVYTGTVEIDDREYSCRMNLPDADVAVYELKEGLLCD